MKTVRIRLLGAVTERKLLSGSLRTPDDLLIAIGPYRFARSGTLVMMSRQPAQMLAAVLARHGGYVTRDEIEELLWGDRSDGGPEFTDRAMDVRAMECAQAAAALGFRFTSVKTRGFSTIPVVGLRESVVRAIGAERLEAAE